ncbi:MAG TPA: NADH-quinone oxidoreductase subunit N, partial [Holophaga sp.]|nr:NADH-quinone oxidoreductase subunit N [Holophaga sp.]
MIVITHDLAALLPLALPAAAACLLPIAALDRDQSTQKWIRGAMFFIALLALFGSFFYVTQLWASGHQPAYGQLRMDRLGQFAAIFLIVTAIVTVLQLWDHLHQEGWVRGETLALLMASVSGMMLFTCTTNLMLLFLGLEVFSIPLYALTATVRLRAGAVEGGMKYFLTGAVASSCFLMGAVLLYGVTGTLELQEMAGPLGAPRGLDPLALAGAALLVLGFLFKVSAAPFHQWTPDAYEGAPHPVAGFMSVATKGAALLALLRVFPGLIAGPGSLLGTKLRLAIALAAVLTMVLGNLTALVQTNVKRMLAYSSISHAGYLLLAFVAGTHQAFTGLLFYLIAYLFMNLGAFGLLTAYGLVGERTS